MKKFLSFSFLILFSTVSRSDILFIDFNFSDLEIAAAQRAAEKRNEKLIVYPEPEVRAKWKEAYTLMNRLQGQLVNECSGKVSAKKNCSQLEENLNKSKEDFEQIKTANEIKSKKLNDIVQSLSDKKTNLSSFIVSGHSTNGKIFGVTGEINSDDINNAFESIHSAKDASNEQNAENDFKNNIRSILLWGCNTATPNELSSRWKTIFPNAEIIAGFNHSAPLGSLSSSSQLLENLLLQEKKLTDAKDKKRVTEQVNRLMDVLPFGKRNLIVCKGDEIYSSSEVINKSEVFKACEKIDKKKIWNQYLCYKNASTEKCANPPANPASSELRDLYNKIQSSRQCFTDTETPDLEFMVRLIYFQNIKSNFINQHSASVDSLNKLLQTLGVPDSLLFKNIQSLSRAEILMRLNKNIEFVSKLTQKDAKFFKANYPEAKTAERALYEMQALLGDLNKTPINWIESVPQEKAGNFAMLHPEAIQQTRKTYEEDRGKFLITEKFESLIKNTKDAEKLRASMAQSSQMTSFDSLNDYSNAQVDYKKEATEIIKKYNMQIKAYAENLKAQDYQNPEGKTYFVKGLEQNLANVEWTELDWSELGRWAEEIRF